MATSWRDILPQVLAERGVAISSVRENSPAEPAPNEPNGANGELPAHVVNGLARLNESRAPGRIAKGWWSHAVAGARHIAEHWAIKALALGWSDSDLFGLGIDGNPYADGLGAWLQGRELLALSEQWAVAKDTEGRRHYFNRPRAQGAVLLWKLGGRG